MTVQRHQAEHRVQSRNQSSDREYEVDDGHAARVEDRLAQLTGGEQPPHAKHQVHDVVQHVYVKQPQEHAVSGSGHSQVYAFGMRVIQPSESRNEPGDADQQKYNSVDASECAGTHEVRSNWEDVLGAANAA